MIYLLLAVLASSLISIIMRLGEGRIKNNISTLAVNYMICLLLGIFYSAGSSLIVPPESGRMTIILGLINGVFYLSAFIVYQYNISKNGVVMSSTFMKLSILVPTLMSIVVFGERPGILQTAGMVLALAAILIVSGEGSSNDGNAGSVSDTKALILLLLIGGSGDAMSKVYEEVGRPEFSSQFLLYTFAVALVLCIGTALVKGQKFTKYDILFGILIGVPNYYSARCLLLALSDIPAVVAYPTDSVLIILVVSIAGVLLFGEKLTRRQWTAVGIIIASMVLLNI